MHQSSIPVLQRFVAAQDMISAALLVRPGEAVQRPSLHLRRSNRRISGVYPVPLDLVSALSPYPTFTFCGSGGGGARRLPVAGET